jgi:hypothetical protein
LVNQELKIYREDHFYGYVTLFAYGTSPTENALHITDLNSGVTAVFVPNYRTSKIMICTDWCWGTQRSWLRHCAASQKVMGSIPNGVIGIFH